MSAGDGVGSTFTGIATGAVKGPLSPNIARIIASAICWGDRVRRLAVFPIPLPPSFEEASPAGLRLATRTVSAATLALPLAAELHPALNSDVGVFVNDGAANVGALVSDGFVAPCATVSAPSRGFIIKLMSPRNPFGAAGDAGTEAGTVILLRMSGALFPLAVSAFTCRTSAGEYPKPVYRNFS